MDRLTGRYFRCEARQSVGGTWTWNVRLAAERAAARIYFVPPEHTMHARQILAASLLAVEQAVVLETDSSKAGEIARILSSRYLALPNYVNNLRRLGFGDEDLVDGGTDRLVDSIVAWGDMSAVTDRVRAYQSTGADHVCVQVLPPDPQALPMPQWREVASALLKSK